ncbi:MAG: sugar transferase [Anaerolineae bacterium]|nr:sugar transferase [Anaerolineae bacterium]
MARRSARAGLGAGCPLYMGRDGAADGRELSQGVGLMVDSRKRARARRGWKEAQWLMPLVDVLLVFASFGLAYFVRYDLQIFVPLLEPNRAPFQPYIPYAIIYAIWLLLMYRGSGLYRIVRGRSWFDELSMIINGVTNATVVLLAISFVFQPLVFSRLMLAYVAAITIVLLGAARVVRRMILAHLRERGVGIQRVLVVGAGDVGGAVLRTMMARKDQGFVPVGYLDQDPTHASVDLGRVKGLGGIDNLERVIRELDVDHVVITLPWALHDRIVKLIQTCQQVGVEVSVVPDVFQLNLRQVLVENLDGIPLLRVNGYVPFRANGRLMKRALDLALIIIAVPFALVIGGLVALAIRLEGPGPIFYTAPRVGENGSQFHMIKFRSMIRDADKLRGELIKTQEVDPRRPKIKNDPRVTRVGRFIRSSSLDELPNLVNVLRGHMSIVGPRPPTPDEVKLYEPWHMQRLAVKPGLTGLWQVSGRSEIPFDEMCLLDIYYIENWSIQLDAQILMLTIPRVLSRHGAY